MANLISFGKIGKLVAIITIFLGSSIIALTSGHVRLRQPPNRSSLWRDPAFEHLDPPPNYDDDGLYCGRVHQQEIVETCGICGDPFIDPTPRANEDGGTFGRGIISSAFTAGQEIKLSAEFTIAHKGFFEVHLCDKMPESESCFRRLTFGDGSSRFSIPVEVPIWVNTTVQLPSDVSCTQCVLRLHYRAGNNWGNCGNGTEAMGCGLQETFRSCSDISILPSTSAYNYPKPLSFPM